MEELYAASTPLSMHDDGDGQSRYTLRRMHTFFHRHARMRIRIGIGISADNDAAGGKASLLPTSLGRDPRAVVKVWQIFNGQHRLSVRDFQSASQLVDEGCGPGGFHNHQV